VPERGVRVVLVTGPDPATLESIGRVLVEERLAACVNVLPDVTSVYRWEGDLHRDSEALAILKTTADRVPGLQARVLELHPYEEPEFICLPIEGGSPSYLEWLAGSVADSSVADSSARYQR
jgi:periplasmic divalent cation tolerance protein